MKLRAGDWVKVKTKTEILATLDRNGRLDEMPFMPQMFQYCGQPFRVYKRAHKTCDTVNGTGGRRVTDAIHLDIRCDGEAYGGCQAACLIFWKMAWLRKTDAAKICINGEKKLETNTLYYSRIANCTETDILAGIKRTGGTADTELIYTCQATQLPYFTSLLRWWDVRQYIEDYTSANASLGRIAKGCLYVTYHLLAKRRRLGRPFRWFYDIFQSLLGGAPYPRRSGSIPLGQGTPSARLNLRPGELVRVKPYKEILMTIDANNRNKGLWFDAEHVPYCGGVYRVKSRVNKIIDEKTGKLILLKNESIILDGVICQARFSDCRMFCPRSIYPWWREIWLERLSPNFRNLDEVRR